MVPIEHYTKLGLLKASSITAPVVEKCLLFKYKHLVERAGVCLKSAKDFSRYNEMQDNKSARKLIDQSASVEMDKY